MKRVARLAILTLFAVATPARAASNAENEIIRATRAHFEALNSGDVEAHLHHHAAERTVFLTDGDSLRVYTSLDEQRHAMSATADKSFQSHQELHDIRVQLYGNVAVVTCYVTGTITKDGGAVEPVRERRTAVLVKQGKEWKEVHLHSSPLAPAR